MDKLVDKQNTKGSENMNFNIHDSAREQIDNLLTQAQKQEKSFRIYIRRISG